MTVARAPAVLVPRRSSARRPIRRAFTLLELIVTCLLLGVLFTAMVPLLATTARQRQASDRRLAATNHASNVLERWTALDYAELTVGSTTNHPLPDEVARLLPGGVTEVSVADETAGPPARRIAVTVRWQDRHGPARPVRLTGWVFHSREAP